MAHWFDTARFGMFVHWSSCSARGWELSWPIFGATEILPHAHKVDVEEYYADATSFAPDPGCTDGWARAARDAGMAYVVLTTKHHDGFALFRSEHSTFSAYEACGRDLVAEFVESCRREDLRVGFYHSLSDWRHPDYPPATDEHYLQFLGRRPPPDAWERYVAYLHGQVRELCTNYGPVDVFWFDGQWERTADEWGAAELAAMIRELQPDALLNDRLPNEGDFATPEQSVPPTPPDGRWETCLTMNETWGFHPHDTAYKSEAELVRVLCETASKGGNLLLNVSPDGTGAIPDEQADRLAALGRWVGANRDAIVDTRPGLEPWQFYGPSTRRGDAFYLHVLGRPFGPLTVRGVPVRRVDAVRHLATGTPLAYRASCTAEEQLTSPDPVGEISVDVPDELVAAPATVIELVVRG